MEPMAKRARHVQPPVSQRHQRQEIHSQGHQSTSHHTNARDGASDEGNYRPDCRTCTAYLLSRRYNNALLSSAVRGAFVSLDKLAIDADNNATKAKAEVASTLKDMRSELVKMVDCKMDELEAEIQDHLETSLGKLKSLNSAECTGKQRFVCQRTRLMSIFRSSFQEIAFLYGTHILDLPLDVLSHIVGYLSPKSVFAARAVCLQFWSAVCQVYGCVNCTFSADVVKDASGRWIVSGSDIIVTPCMNFQVSVHTVPAGGIGVYFYVTKRKHYAQAKKAIIQLITPGSKKHKQSCFLETYHLADPIKPWGTVFTDLQANKTSKVHFSATLQDCSHTSRGKSSRPRVTKH